MLLLFVSLAFAIDLTKPVAPENLSNMYSLNFKYQGVEDVTKSWSPELLKNKDYAIVEGNAAAILLDATNDIFALAQSRIVYVKRSLAPLSTAVDPLGKPYPPPIYDPHNFSNNKVSETHEYTLFDFLYKQTVKIFTIKANCRAAAHYQVVSAQQRRIQTVVGEGIDPEDPNKLIFREAFQTTDLIAINDQVTAVLLRNLAVSKRHRLGFILPSPDDLKNAAIDMSNTSLKAVLNKLGISSNILYLR